MEAREGLRAALARVSQLAAMIPGSIKDGTLERALRDLSQELSRVETAQAQLQVVRRPYTGLSDEAKLLGDYAEALRLRMMQLNKDYVSGLEYFQRRLEDLLRRAERLLGNPYLR